jgi:hypothetical protein
MGTVSAMAAAMIAALLLYIYPPNPCLIRAVDAHTIAVSEQRLSLNPVHETVLDNHPDLTAEMLGTYLPNFDYLLAARTRAEAMPV